MRIATWNVERPFPTSAIVPAILQAIKKVNADIWIFTETHDCINPGDEYHAHHCSPVLEKKVIYKTGERRVSIYSKYPINKIIPTFRDDTSICVSIQTPMGPLAVYGTVLGIYGNRGEEFKDDLKAQILDFERISQQEKNFCIAGDLNMTFSDNYYYTKEGRDKLNTIFDKLEMTNLTAGIARNIDHIVMSKSFISGKPTTIQWNDPVDKKLSDHMGVAINII